MPIAREVRARFVAEIAGLRNGFRDVQREAERLGPSVRRSTDEANRNYDRLNNTLSRLSGSLSATQDIEPFKNLDKSAKRAQREFRRTGQVSEQTMERLSAAVNEANQSMDNMSGESRANMSALSRVIESTREQIDTMTEAVSVANSELSDVGRDTGLAGANRELADTAEELENVQEQAEAAADEMEGLGDAASEQAGRMGESFGRAGRTIVNSTEQAFDGVNRAGQNLRRRMDRLDPFYEIERESRQLSRNIGRPIENLPEHLVPFRESLTETRQELREIGRSGSESLNDLAQAAVRSRIGAEALTSMTSSGKEAARVVQGLTEDTRTAQLAVMGLNEDGTIAISTEESERRLAQFRTDLDRTRTRLEALRDAGDMGSYVAGMRQVERSLLDVDRSMMAAARGGRHYNTMLREMGIYTSDTANQMGIDMERYRVSFMRNLDMMNARSTLSKKMMDFLPESSRIQRLDRFFLGISNNLERVAQRGTAANLAIELLGRNAPMKKIMDMTRMIQQGVMGVQQLTLGASVVFAGFTAIMAAAASGPMPSDIAAKEEALITEYAEEVQKRADEIMSTWSSFEDVDLKIGLDPQEYIWRIEEQVQIYQDFVDNLDALEVKIDNDRLMSSLRGMGPEITSELIMLNEMTDEQLAHWVSEWEEKSRLATQAAVTELEWMRIKTEEEIAVLRESLTPLSIAWENFLQTWSRAMAPFVATWGVLAAKVVDGATAIGEFINKLNALTPQITAAAGMFMYLASGLFILLAPLGVGIGLIKGMRANFSALFLMLKPAVVAFFRVAGAVTVVAGVLVGLGLVFYNLWTKSENLRVSLTNAFDRIRDSVSAAFAVVKPSLDRLGGAFKDLMANVFGDGERFKMTWKDIGDAIARFVNAAMTNYFPIFQRALGNMSTAAIIAIEWLIAAFGKISGWWDVKGPAIVAVVKSAFNSVADFIGSTIQKIVTFFETDGAQILQAAKNVFGFIGNIVSSTFKGILAVIEFIMPAVLLLVRAIWNNIKGIITGALDVIMGAVKIFSGLFTGDFSKMWEGVKQLFFGAISFIMNLISLTFYGKILQGARLFITLFRSGFTSMWNAVKALFTQGPAAALAYLKRGWNDMVIATRNVWNFIIGYLRDTWNSIKSITSGAINGVKIVFTRGWSTIVNATSTAFYSILSFLIKIFNTIWRTIQNAVQGYYNTVDAGWRLILRVTRNTFSGIFNTIKAALNTTWTFIRNIFNAISTFLWKTLENIWVAFTAGWRNIRVTTETVFRSIRTFIRSIWQAIRDFISSTVNGISDRVYRVWSGVLRFTQTAFRDVYNAVKNRFNDIVDMARALPGRISDGIKAMANKVKAGITTVINLMARTLGKGMNGVIKGLNWVLEKMNVDIQIREWNVPQWAKGTEGHPGGPMIVGDGTGANAGPELIQTPDGKQYLSPDKPTLTSAPKGTRIWSATDTRKLLAGVPQYAFGDMARGVKSFGRRAISGAKEFGSRAMDGIRAVGTAVKDKVVDIFSYIKNPGKLLNLALDTLGIERPEMSGYTGRIVKGTYDRLKSEAIGYVKGKLSDFAATIGNGKGDFGAPFRRTSGYGPRKSPGGIGSTMHKGVDYAAPIGTPIPSQSSGQVVIAGYHGLRGNYVKIQSGNLSYLYQHNSRNLVRAGQFVRKGQIVGTVGSTGASTGPHLHYEVARNGVEFNPEAIGGTSDVAAYMKKGLGKVAAYANGAFGVDQKQLAWIADGGWAESIISHDPAKRTRQQAIWEKTGDALGFSGGDVVFDPEMYALLERIAVGVETGQTFYMDKDVLARKLKDPITKLQQTDKGMNDLFRKG